MGLFGRSEASAAAWPLDVLTLEYLISGQVEGAAQKWGWSYFSPLQKDVPQELSLTVSGARATGARPAPTWTAVTAGFAYGTSLVALISRGQATDQIWDKWAASVGQPVPVEALVGPYAITGTMLSPDGTLSALLNDRFAMRDATITRVDGAGQGSIEAARAMVSTAFVHTAVLTG